MTPFTVCREIEYSESHANGETMVPFSLHSKPVLGLLRHVT